MSESQRAAAIRGGVFLALALFLFAGGFACGAPGGDETSKPTSPPQGIVGSQRASSNPRPVALFDPMYAPSSVEDKREELVTEVDEQFLEPQLPWVFEVSKSTGWVPGPRGIAVDSAAVVWSFDHSKAPWIPADRTGEFRSAADYSMKFEGAVPRHRVDPELFQLICDVAREIDAEPMQAHQPLRLDVMDQFNFLAWESSESRYREILLVGTDRRRMGSRADLLLVWAELQMGDAGLRTLPPKYGPAGTLNDMKREARALLDSE